MPQALYLVAFLIKRYICNILEINLNIFKYKVIDMKIEIGKVLKAQGIKGEIKLVSYLDDSTMLKNVKQLYVGTKTYTIEKIRFDGEFCYVLLDGIADRNTAEGLRNWSVYADKECLALKKDRYFITDLIGCKVTLENGDIIGTVKDVLQYGAADVFVCDKDGKTVSFPFLNDLVLSVNVDNKTIALATKRFCEVAVYED